MADLKFTDEQRLIIAMLCDVLSEPQTRQFSQENVDLIRHAVTGGHDWAVEWELQTHFPPDADSPDDVAFVADVLDMWEFIELRWGSLNGADQQQIRDAVPTLGEAPLFEGFDPNSEARYGAIARTMIEKLHRFAALSERTMHAPSPRSQGYRSMLPKWTKLRTKLASAGLSAEDVIDLLNSRQDLDSSFPSV